MSRNYFIKPVSSSDDQLPKRWLEQRSDLLRSVGSPTKPSSISTGDLLLYYSAGDQKLIGIARATKNGTDAKLGGKVGYELTVQPMLMIPDLAFAPTLSEAGIPPGKVMNKPFAQLTDDEYASAHKAIVRRTLPETARTDEP